MQDLFFALGIVFLVEGILYALFPHALKKMMLAAVKMPESTLRYAGLAAAVFGFCVIYAVKQ